MLQRKRKKIYDFPKMLAGKPLHLQALFFVSQSYIDDLEKINLIPNILYISL